MKMKIGVIGAGAIGLAFAKRAAAAGHEVIISNSRGPASLSAATKDVNGLQAGTREAAVQADVIMVAVPWQHLDAAILRRTAGCDSSGEILKRSQN